MPLSVEDRFTITESIHRLSQALDVVDADAVLACLTPDVTVVIPEGTVVGHGPYRELLEAAGDVEVPVQHWAGNVVVDGDGERATARAYVLGAEGPRSDGSFGVSFMGTIDYSAVRTGGTWLFDRLTVKRDKPAWFSVEGMTK